MTTQARKDFDDELAAWLEMVHAEQSVSELDRLADLVAGERGREGDPGSAV